MTSTPKRVPLDAKLAREFGLIKYVNELREYDHAFLTVGGAEYFSQPFGFRARTSVHYANPEDPKGLTFDNGAKQANGVSAHDLAGQICRHLGVKYDEKMGRGSQLRACCDALDAWIKG
jgi:hypothetical protein